MAKVRPTISTHVLDLETGAPAASFPVALFRLGEDGQPELLTEAETDGDGRVPSLVKGLLRPGSYQLIFDVAAYLEISEQQVANYRFAAVKKISENVRSAGLSPDVFPELHQMTD